MEELKFQELFIHEDVWETPVAQRARSLLKVTALKVSARPYAEKEGRLSGHDFNASKKLLYLSRHEGHFFRKCPGTHGAACCNYFVLNLGVQCPMNCTYCYLQSYINSPVSQIYTNIEDALMEMEQILASNPGKPFRVGTGETIDSLATDDLTLYSQKLVDWFAFYPHLTCEFKTKTNNIKNFVNMRHASNVVVSFSINPSSIVESEERETASLNERLEAAQEVSLKGFPVAFHIDPMIYTPNWPENYSELVEQVACLFKPEALKWISVGALRYPPDMKNMLRERFPEGTKSLRGELFPSSDGKLRYDQSLRNEMFRHVITEFQKRDRRYPVFLCMESPESWFGTFGVTPRKVDLVAPLFRPL